MIRIPTVRHGNRQDAKKKIIAFLQFQFLAGVEAAVEVPASARVAAHTHRRYDRPSSRTRPAPAACWCGLFVQLWDIVSDGLVMSIVSANVANCADASISCAAAPLRNWSAQRHTHTTPHHTTPHALNAAELPAARASHSPPTHNAAAAAAADD
jgi:hypothetical protein